MISPSRCFDRAATVAIREPLHERNRCLRSECREIEFTGALGLRVGAGHLLRIVGYEPLDLIGGERRVLLQDKRHCARHHCRGLGRTASSEVAITEPSFIVRCIDE